MSNKVYNVFYGADGLPYKDREHSVHYPIVGNEFMGSSNITEFHFYLPEENGLYSTLQLAVIGKLPNGKRGFKLLGSRIWDNDLGMYYFSFTLGSFFTQYKGNLFLSLGVYNGTDINYDNEEQIYEMEGNPVIARTGEIKVNIAYATEINGSDEEIETWQEFLAALGDRLKTSDGIVVVENNSVDVSGYDENQIFYCPSENSIYGNSSGNLSLLWDLNDLDDKIGVIYRTGIVDLSHGLSAVQLEEAKKPICFLFYNYSTTREIYIKYSGYKTGETQTYLKFENIHKNIEAGSVSGTWKITEKEFIFLASDGSLDSQVNNTYTTYEKSEVDNLFANKNVEETIHAIWTFDPYSLPQTSVDPSEDTELARKKYVDDEIDYAVNNRVVTGVKGDEEVDYRKGNVNISKANIGLGNVDNVQQIPLSQKGANSGVAELDNNGKVPVSQIPDAVLGQVEYCGTWDANSSTDQTTHTLRKGDYYICTTSGSYNPDGTSTGISYVTGDWAIYSGSAWTKIDNTDAVQGVKGSAEATYRTGNVNITKANIGLGNVDNTSDLDKPVSTATQTALNGKVDNATLNEYQSKFVIAPLSVTTDGWTVTDSGEYTKTITATWVDNVDPLGLGMVNVNDEAKITAGGSTTSDIKNNADIMSNAGVYLINVFTDSDENGITTSIVLGSKYQVGENFNAVVSVFHYTYNQTQNTALDINDIDNDTIVMQNSKLKVNTDILKRYKHNLYIDDGNGFHLTLTIINKSNTPINTYALLESTLNDIGITSSATVYPANGVDTNSNYVYCGINYPSVGLENHLMLVGSTLYDLETTQLTYTDLVEEI